MDYWTQVTWHRWPNWQTFIAQLPGGSRLWYIERGGLKRYDEVKFKQQDYLVFGRETAGLPRALLESNQTHWLRIPMFNAETRSLNLSNCVALVLYEALRQQGFAAENTPEA